MKERPILFSGPMVRAILNGTKTQTRRVVKPQPSDPSCRGIDAVWGYGTHRAGEHVGKFMLHAAFAEKGKRVDRYLPCPYGKPGTLLWVRETWLDLGDGITPDGDMKPCGPLYRADHSTDVMAGQWKPSIHMPRKASRIKLEITGIRVERLNDISEKDARNEGIYDGGCLNCGNSEPCVCGNPSPCARDSFINLWESINGPGSWAANPWVWVVTFKRIKP